jgi:hypothetical protein
LASDRKKIPISRARLDLTGGVGGEVSEKTQSFSINKKKKSLLTLLCFTMHEDEGKKDVIDVLKKL